MRVQDAQEEEEVLPAALSNSAQGEMEVGGSGSTEAAHHAAYPEAAAVEVSAQAATGAQQQGQHAATAAANGGEEGSEEVSEDHRGRSKHRHRRTRRRAHAHSRQLSEEASQRVRKRSRSRSKSRGGRRRVGRSRLSDIPASPPEAGAVHADAHALTPNQQQQLPIAQQQQQQQHQQEDAGDSGATGRGGETHQPDVNAVCSGDEGQPRSRSRDRSRSPPAAGGKPRSTQQHGPDGPIDRERQRDNTSAQGGEGSNANGGGSGEGAGSRQHGSSRDGGVVGVGDSNSRRQHQADSSGLQETGRLSSKPLSLRDQARQPASRRGRSRSRSRSRSRTRRRGSRSPDAGNRRRRSASPKQRRRSRSRSAPGKRSHRSPSPARRRSSRSPGRKRSSQSPSRRRSSHSPARKRHSQSAVRKRTSMSPSHRRRSASPAQKRSRSSPGRQGSSRSPTAQQGHARDSHDGGSRPQRSPSPPARRKRSRSRSSTRKGSLLNHEVCRSGSPSRDHNRQRSERGMQGQGTGAAAVHQPERVGSTATLRAAATAAATRDGSSAPVQPQKPNGQQQQLQLHRPLPPPPQQPKVKLSFAEEVEEGEDADDEGPHRPARAVAGSGKGQPGIGQHFGRRATVTPASKEGPTIIRAVAADDSNPTTTLLRNPLPLGSGLPLASTTLSLLGGNDVHALLRKLTAGATAAMPGATGAGGLPGARAGYGMVHAGKSGNIILAGEEDSSSSGLHDSSDELSSGGRGKTPPGKLGRVVFGVAQARCTRPYMEDRHCCVSCWRPISANGRPLDDGIERSYAGLFDGHNGDRSAEVAASRLHMLLAADPVFRTHTGEWGPPAAMAAEEAAVTAALKRAFHTLDEDLLRQAEEDGGRDGATALVLLRLADTLYLAHLGDSRAVLCRARGVAQALTRDHKPDLPQERARVEAAGGRVEFQRCWRVIVEPTLYRPGSGLAVSRSLGDIDFKKPLRLVDAVPEVSRYVPKPGDAFVIMASDGLWDVMSDQDAVDIVYNSLQGCKGVPTTAHATAAAEAALNMAVRRGTLDNVTVLVMAMAWGSSA